MLLLFWNLQHQGNQNMSQDTVEIMKVGGKGSRCMVMVTSILDHVRVKLKKNNKGTSLTFSAIIISHVLLETADG